VGKFAERPNRAVFLDRDGVLNEVVMRGNTPCPPSGVDDLVLTPGAVDGCERLKNAGFVLVVVTNQPDVARGTRNRETVDAINRELRRRLPLDAVHVCFHDDGDQCRCRKPAPGMLLDAAAELDIDLTESFMVGDRWRDIDAGRRAGCRTLLVDRGYDEGIGSEPDHRTSSFAEAAVWIVAHQNREVTG